MTASRHADAQNSLNMNNPTINNLSYSIVERLVWDTDAEYYSNMLPFGFRRSNRILDDAGYMFPLLSYFKVNLLAPWKGLLLLLVVIAVLCRTII